MRTTRKDLSAPPRLIEGTGPVAEGLRGFARRSDVDESEGEAEAWRNLRRRVETPQRGVTIGMWLGALAVAVVCILLVRQPRSSERPATAVAPASTPAAPPQPAPAPARIASLPVTPRPTALPPATVVLVDHAQVTLSAGGAATMRGQGDAALIELAAGNLEIETVPRGRVRVVAGAFTFVDVGTSFAVTVGTRATELRVTEGSVEVWRQQRRLGVVSGPAGFWTSAKRVEPPGVRLEVPTSSGVIERPPSAAPTQPPTTMPAVISAPLPAPTPLPRPLTCPPPANAAEVAQAIACRQEQARGQGLTAETALYEIGRLQRERGDLPAAVAAFEAFRARFPRGSLRLDVDLSLVDLLPRLGRHADALTESARLLAENPRVERADELRVLRGNIYREVLSDCAAAEREYAAVALEAGRAGDDAAFFRAACLERLGRRDEAAQLYRAYLRREHPVRQSEARRRLGLLSQ